MAAARGDRDSKNGRRLTRRHVGARRREPIPLSGVARRSAPCKAAPTMRRDGDDRGPRRDRLGRRLARNRSLRPGAGAHRRALLDDLGVENEPLYTPGERRRRLHARPRLPGRGSVHPRGVPVDVPRPPVDDAPVRGLRHRGGDERALPLPPRPRPDGALDRVRHAHAHGLRLGPRALARRGRARGRRGRLARRHGDALRGHPARRRLDLDDDQLAGGDRARLLRLRRRGAGRPARRAPRHRADGHPQGVHRAEGVDLPARAVDAARRRHDRVLRAGDAALPPDLDLRATTSARPARPRRRSSPSRSPTASPTSRRRSSAGSTSTTSRRGSPSSSTRTSTSSRRSRSTARRAGSGRASCATASARATSARCSCASTRRPPASR